MYSSLLRGSTEIYRGDAAGSNRVRTSFHGKSNANDDLPDPLTPVITIIFPLGMSILIFFRLCSRAPFMRRMSGLDFGLNKAVFIKLK